MFQRQIMDTKQKHITILLIVLGGIFCCTTSYGQIDGGDWSHRYGLRTNISLGNSFQFLTMQEFRFPSADPQLNYFFHEMGIGYKQNKMLKTDLRYRTAFDKEGQWLLEHRFHVNQHVKWKVGKFSFKYRFRTEYRVRKENDNEWRIRNRLMVGYPVKISVLEFTPFLSEEVFFDFEKPLFNRSRLETGISFKVSDSVSIIGAYFWQVRPKNDSFNDENVFKIRLKLDI